MNDHKHNWQPSLVGLGRGGGTRPGYVCETCKLNALPPKRADKLKTWKDKMGVSQ